MPPDQQLRAAATLNYYSQRPWAIERSMLGVIAAAVRHPTTDALTDALALTPADGEPGDQRPRARQPVRLGQTTDGVTIAGAVAVIALRGVITPRPSFLSMLFGFGGGGLQGFREDFRDALDDDDVGSILIDIDSPGGLVDLIPETAAEIRGGRGRKPIVAVANTRAASAAYWLGAQADELVVTPSGEVGSIGVFMVHDDFSKFNEELGVAVTYIKAGKFKTEGNPDEPLSDDAKAHWQQLVDEPYSLFVSDVAAGRNVSEATVRDGFGQGRVLPAQMALDAGMVDSIETYEQVVARLVNRAPTGSTNGAAAAAAADPAAVLAAAQAQTAAAAATDPAAQPPARREDQSPPPAPMASPAWLAFPTPRPI
jgi:signal peptide peptidase SppA